MQVQAGRLTLAREVESLSASRRAGVISDATFLRAFGAAQIASDALRAMEEADGRGDIAGYRTAVIDFRSSFGRLHTIRTEAEQQPWEPNASSSRPSKPR